MFNFSFSWGECGNGRYVCVAWDIFYPGRYTVLILDSMNNRIVATGQDGKFLFTFGSIGDDWNQFYNPMGLCVSGPRIFVCDSDNKRIQIFHGGFYHFKSIHTMPNRPTEICNLGRNQVLVLVMDPKLIEDKFMVLDRDGNLLKIIRYDNGRINVGRICTNSLGQIIISDWAEALIYTLDADGNILHNFGSRGKGSGQIEWPKGIAADQWNNIYVADKLNNRITIFNPKGIPLRQIQFQEPHSICLLHSIKYRYLHIICSSSVDNTIRIFSSFKEY